MPTTSPSADPEGTPPSADALTPAQILAFRRKLMLWYREHARVLPWRSSQTHKTDAYQTWVSEVMLQQTRVAAVLEHYTRFLARFPTLIALALAPESDVLAAWSGLGYYRRARMLHKAAQFVVAELNGVIPETAEGLRTLPGIGEYTCAAIASIAFGESIAVVDGNVERVLLRVTGRPAENTAAAHAFTRQVAAALIPHRRLAETSNAAGDHNQAMMELGATLCLPRAPLCLQCPVFDLCRTRGEHAVAPRGKPRSQPAAYLLATRKRGVATEVLLVQRDPAASIMAGLFELPPLPMDAVLTREPLLRLRHSITNTNYYVEIHGRNNSEDHRDGSASLRKAITVDPASLCWQPLSRLAELPLTGLARKALMRLDLFSVVGPATPRRHI